MSAFGRILEENTQSSLTISFLVGDRKRGLSIKFDFHKTIYYEEKKGEGKGGDCKGLGI